MKAYRITALILALMLLAGTGALAQGTLTVKGFGSVKVDANRAEISLGVREVAKEVQEAQGRVNEKIGSIVETLKQLGVADDAISTNGIGVYPNYNYEEGETISDYTAYNNIYIAVQDLSNTGAYIDAAFAAGANSLDYVEFSAADTEAAAAKALALAVESATEKAQIIADAAGVKLGAIVEIRDGGDVGFDGSGIYAKNAVAEDAGAGTQVMASKQAVSASVSITFALEDAE